MRIYFHFKPLLFLPLRPIFIAPILLISVSLCFGQQQPLGASLGSINRTTPQIGFNTNAHLAQGFPQPSYSGANWNQQWFIDSTASIYPEILRYPGGLNSNHWDWVTGWFRPGFEPASPPVTVRADEFKQGVNACNAEGLYVVNLETSDAHYEMDGLRHAEAIGLSPTLFELGNEHNLQNGNFPNQYMTSLGYAQLAKIYYDSIKIEYPNGKVCAVGGNTNGRPDWHTVIETEIPTIEAFAWHVYTNADNVDHVFNVNRALAVPFGTATDNNSLAFRFIKGGFNSLQPGREVWATEYNLWEQQIASSPVIAETWTHFLYLNAMHHFFLSQPSITMFLNHSLASVNTFYYSISNYDKHITANGIAMQLLLDVSRGSSTCQDMVFTGNPSMVYNNISIPKLTGWKFNHTGTEKGFVCNYSADTFRLSLANVFSNSMLFDQYFADTALVVNGLSSINKTSGSSSDSITILPFSFTQITAETPLPVEFADPLQAKKVNGGIEVMWATETENNCDKFEVERSGGAGIFEKIKTVKGSGNSSSYRLYKITDTRPLNKHNYYRIKQIDFDGRYKYSRIVAAQYENPVAKIFPNPAGDELFFETNDHVEKIEIISTMGRVVETINNPEKAINLESLPTGVYYLRLFGNSYQSIIMRFCKS